MKIIKEFAFLSVLFTLVIIGIVILMLAGRFLFLAAEHWLNNLGHL